MAKAMAIATSVEHICAVLPVANPLRSLASEEILAMAGVLEVVEGSLGGFCGGFCWGIKGSHGFRYWRVRRATREGQEYNTNVFDNVSLVTRISKSIFKMYLKR